jgi:hypothetical protein
MSKEKLIVVYYEEDDQVDLEVYSWLGEDRPKGAHNEDLSEFAFSSMDKAKDYVTDLKSKHDVMLETTYEEQNKLDKTSLEQMSLPNLEPHYKTFYFSYEELEGYITIYLSKRINENVTIELIPDFNDDGPIVDVDMSFHDNYDWTIERIQEEFWLKDTTLLSATMVLKHLLKCKDLELYIHPVKGNIVVSMPY